jgi:hypothetical protein
LVVECGLGGSPLVEPGLDNVGPSVLVEEDNALSSVLVGICKDERLGPRSFKKLVQFFQ